MISKKVLIVAGDAVEAFENINPELYDGLIIPGGRAPEYILKK